MPAAEPIPNHPRLDPTLPMVWEGPDALRFGFDRAEARVVAPSAAAQRFLAELRHGRSRRPLPQIAQAAGLSAEERDALLALLAPLLQDPSPPPATPPRVRVRGSQPAAATLAAAIQRVTGADVSGSDDADLTLIIERFIRPPAGTQRLLAAGAPLLIVRFTDRSVTVGPVHSPHEGPCPHCALLLDAARTPALGAIAAQVLGEHPAAETPASVEVTAALTATLVSQWWGGDPEPRHHRYRIAVDGGGIPNPVVTRERVARHPDCACATLGDAGRVVTG